MNLEELKFWFNGNCRSILEDIIILKKYWKKNYDMIISHLHSNDIDKLLFLENTRLKMDGHTLQRTKFDLIDIINRDVVDGLYKDYFDIFNLLC